MCYTYAPQYKVKLSVDTCVFVLKILPLCVFQFNIFRAQHIERRRLYDCLLNKAKRIADATPVGINFVSSFAYKNLCVDILCFIVDRQKIENADLPFHKPGTTISLFTLQ